MNADYRQAILDGAVDVVREDGEIVAVVVTRDRGDHLLLENIAVAPSRQGGGFGAQILDWAETRTRALGHDEVRLYTHEKMVENVAFYLRHGFEITGIADEDEFRRIHFRKVCRRDTDQIRRAP
ncbi:GNAT family N-acetyltransferase [Mumia zhuanghuii]|nr:GNAT family N-acetyltransferase [Mumia zhuanghuii]